MTPLRSRSGRESSRQYQRSSVSSGKALRGERGGVHPIPAGRLVRQPPIDVFGRRRWALRATVSDVRFSSVIRAELHRLVDELPDESVDAAGVLLTRAQDPLVAALEAAPLDDEPYTEDDRAASVAGWAAYQRGEAIKVGELRAEPEPDA